MGSITLNAALTGQTVSHEYALNLTTASPSTTPLAFSRMTDSSASEWGTNDIYGIDGGHIAFVGGNVSWYETLNGNLVNGVGSTANNLNAGFESVPGLQSPGTISIATNPPPPLCGSIKHFRPSSSTFHRLRSFLFPCFDRRFPIRIESPAQRANRPIAPSCSTMLPSVIDNLQMQRVPTLNREKSF